MKAVAVLILIALATTATALKLGCSSATTTHADASGSQGLADATVEDSIDGDRRLDTSPSEDSNYNVPEPPFDARVFHESPFKCSGTTAEPKAPLQKQPKVLWEKVINLRAAVPSPSLNLSGQVAVAISSQVHFFTASGTHTMWESEEHASRLSPPVADKEGTFYMASDTAIAVSAGGQVKWRVPLRGPGPEGGLAPQPFSLDAQGVLYSLQTDGGLSALQSSDGNLIWKTRLFKTVPVGGASILSAQGAYLFVEVSSVGGTVVVDAKDGKVLASFPYSGATTVPGVALGALGFFGRRGATEIKSVGLSDLDSHQIWSLPVDQRISTLWLSFVDLAATMKVVELPTDRMANKPTTLKSLDCKGDGNGGDIQVVARPGRTINGSATLGADGVSYFLATPKIDSFDYAVGTELLALESNGALKWSLVFPGLNLPGSPYRVRFPLGPDGVLYLVLEDPQAIAHVVAVQTQSPGLAATALSIDRYDNSSTGWAPVTSN